MRVESAQQTLLEGKASPASQLFGKKYQPLCSDSEGWGPISPIRYDFTPCFLDVWIISVAAWGLFGGAGAVWFLLKKRVSQEVPKNWHFYAKLVSHIR
jgi:ATP-binding cassette, subfamily C (CFTR/MRP), member 1